MFALALIFTLREAQVLLVPIAIAVVLTFVFVPVVRVLRRAGLPETLGSAVVVIALLAVTVVGVGGLADPAQTWWRHLPTTLSQLMLRLDRLRVGMPGLEPPVARVVTAPTGRAGVPAAAQPTPADPVKERIASEGVALTGALLGRGLSFGTSFAATIILLYFLLASEHWIVSRCIEAVPRRRVRALILGGARAAQRQIGRYLFTMGCVNTGVGVITAAALWHLGLPNPVLWGVVTAVLCFIPYLGPLIVMALLLLAGMMSFGQWPQMVGPFIAFAVIHAIESNVFSPWLVGLRLGLSALSVFVSVMFWGWMWGIAGALLAVPLLIGLRCICVRTRRLRLLSYLLEGGRNRAPSLRSLLQVRWPVRRRGSGAGTGRRPPATQSEERTP